MNKLLRLLPVALLAAFFACEETDDTDKYANWRQRNEAYIDSLATVYATQPGHGGLDSIHLLSDPDGCIYYKKHAGYPATEDVSPLFTDSVTVYYKGANIIGEVFDGNFTGDDPDINFTPPTGFKLNGVVSGWMEILQRMKVGERYMVYIPWEYAYGESGSGSIKGYSTLLFDMQLLKIY